MKYLVRASDIKYRKVYCREREWMNNDYRMVSRDMDHNRRRDEIINSSLYLK